MRWNFLTLLLALVIFLVVTPFFNNAPWGGMALTGAISIVLIISLFAIGHKRSTLRGGLILLIPTLIFGWMIYFVPSQIIHICAYSLGFLFLSYVIVHLSLLIFFSPTISRDTIYGALSIYLLLGLAFAEIYSLIVITTPDAFAVNFTPLIGQLHEEVSFLSENAIYFSFVTLTTLGYGDITPLYSPAKFLSILEAITGQLFIATAIARIMGIYLKKD